MPRENTQKIKLLCLMEILKQETDENHPLKNGQICRKLADMGIPCDRRILRRDIKLLNDYDFNIKQTTIDREHAFYVENRAYSIAELKIIIDAIQAAAFITERKSNDLISRLTHLGGMYSSENLRANMICFNTRKHTNEGIYSNVTCIEEAVRTRRKVTFLYYDLDENKNKVYRKDKARYIADPIALIYNEDNYYLMCYSDKYRGICNYRVDRMDDVALTDIPTSEKANVKASDISDYTEQAFKMYSGKSRNVTIEFEDSLIGVIYDKFGEETTIRRVDENTCKARVTVQVSPTFWGWLFQFGKRIKILSPQSLRNEYIKRCEELLDALKG